MSREEVIKSWNARPLLNFKPFTTSEVRKEIYREAFEKLYTAFDESDKEVHVGTYILLEQLINKVVEEENYE